MALTEEVWRGRRVFVTGHTGFKGTWLAQFLERLGAEVYGYSLAPEGEPSHFSSLKWKNLRHHVGDIRHGEEISKFLCQAKPEVVFHLAAQPLVLRSYREPHYTYETNVMGTLNVLEAIRTCESVKGAVIVTSDKCYENREVMTPYREDDPMGGYDPYSSSKGCAEILTASYRNSFFHPSEFRKKHETLISTVRAGNVIGGGDWSENRLIPDFARAYNAGRKVVLRSPRAIRPWQHVLEPVHGYLLLAQKLLQGDVSKARAYNFGPDPKGFLTVQEIVNLAKAIWTGFDYEIESSEQHEATLLMLNSDLASEDLSWKSKLDVEQAVRWTLDWYKAYYTDKRMITVSQIERYLTL